MSLYNESTKLKPLLFFETFINNEKLTEYETIFYGDWGNPSQTSSKQEGFIEYIKDFYTENRIENVTIIKQSKTKEYFSVSLSKLLYANVSISIAFIEKANLKLEYLNIKSDTYLLRQLIKIQNLKDSINENMLCQDIIKEVLYALQKKIRAISKLSVKFEKKNLRLTNSTYFEVKPITKKSTLKKVYYIAIELDIIDDEMVSENEFLNVLMSSNPSLENNKIKFKANNQVSTLFIDLISNLFEKLTHSQISKSKSFNNKNGKTLNQQDLDTAKNRYIKKLYQDSKLIMIQNSIQKIIPIK